MTNGALAIMIVVILIIALIFAIILASTILTNRMMIDDNRKEINRIYKMMEQQGEFQKQRYQSLSDELNQLKRVIK